MALKCVFIPLNSRTSLFFKEFNVSFANTMTFFGIGGLNVKTLWIVGWLLVGSLAWADEGPWANQFDLGCMSWDEVSEHYDFSQISPSQVSRIQRSHERARSYLNRADEQVAALISLLGEPEDQGAFYEMILICAISEEATLGFRKTCVNDQGEEMITEGLIEACLNLRLEPLKTL
jgi:hypothetical protein